MDQLTLNKILEAVNIDEVKEIAKIYKPGITKENLWTSIISFCFKNPNCILKFVAFLKELDEINFFKIKEIEKTLRIRQTNAFAKKRLLHFAANFNPKKFSFQEDLKNINILFSIFGHFYNNDTLDSDFPLFVLSIFNSYRLNKITILNFWLIIDEKFKNSIKDKERKIVNHIQQEIDKIKVLENCFGNEIFKDTEEEIKNYFQNIPEKKIIDEILDFLHLETNQKELDMIFLLNLHKINLKVSIKEKNYLNEIQKRFKNECYENILDFRHIDESKIHSTFKEFIEKVNENNLELTLTEIAWLGGKNRTLMQQLPEIVNKHIKIFILEVFKQQNSEKFAEYLGKLENISTIFNFFTGLISNFCTGLVECCEELLDQKKVSKVQIFKTVMFAGYLYKYDVIKFKTISKIIYDLDSQNFRSLNKFLGFEIFEKYVKDMKNELEKYSLNTAEILADVEEKMQKTTLESSPKRMKFEENFSNEKSQNYLKIIETKNLLLRDQKYSTKTSIFLDQLHEKLITLEDYDPKKLVAADNLIGLMEAIICRSLESDVIHKLFINLLDKLYEIYKRFEEVLEENFKKIIRKLFNQSIGGAVDWKKVTRLTKMIYDAQLDYECADKNAVKICLLNNAINFACTKDDWNVVFSIVFYFGEAIFIRHPDAYYNYLERLAAIFNCQKINSSVKTEVLMVWEYLLNIEGVKDKNRIERIRNMMKSL